MVIGVGPDGPTPMCESFFRGGPTGPYGPVGLIELVLTDQLGMVMYHTPAVCGTWLWILEKIGRFLILSSSNKTPEKW